MVKEKAQPVGESLFPPLNILSGRAILGGIQYITGPSQHPFAKFTHECGVIPGLQTGAPQRKSGGPKTAAQPITSTKLIPLPLAPDQGFGTIQMFW